MTKLCSFSEFKHSLFSLLQECIVLPNELFRHCHFPFGRIYNPVQVFNESGLPPIGVVKNCPKLEEMDYLLINAQSVRESLLHNNEGQ